MTTSNLGRKGLVLQLSGQRHDTYAFNLTASPLPEVGSGESGGQLPHVSCQLVSGSSQPQCSHLYNGGMSVLPHGKCHEGQQGCASCLLWRELPVPSRFQSPLLPTAFWDVHRTLGVGPKDREPFWQRLSCTEDRGCEKAGQARGSRRPELPRSCLLPCHWRLEASLTNATFL